MQKSRPTTGKAILLRALLAAVAALAIPGGAMPARAADLTGGTDVDVQNAIDAASPGDTITLSGIFTFSNTVSINKDITLAGSSAIIHLTKIVPWVFTPAFSCSDPVAFEARDLTIHLVPFGEAFLIQDACRGATIRGCTIRGLSGTYPGAIVVKNVGNALRGHPGPVKIEVADNVIDSVPEQYVEVASEWVPNVTIGIATDATTCNLIVRNNTIVGVQHSGLWVDHSNKGTVLAEKNRIHGRGYDWDWPGGALWVRNYEWQGPTDILFNDNDISCTGTCFLTIGYGDFVPWSGLATDTVLVAMKNRIAMEDPGLGAAVVFHGGPSNSVVARNTLTGASTNPFFLVFTDGLTSQNNLFQANNISRRRGSSGPADYIFGTGANHNTVVGYAGNVVDDGIGNVYSGVRMPGGNEIGARVSAAQRALHEMSARLQ